MRSIQVTSLDGPRVGCRGGRPGADTGPGEVLVEVQAVGISWPDLLQTRGEYQLKPDLPFQLGVDFAGRGALGAGRGRVAAGDRVACVLPYGGGADLVALGAGLGVPAAGRA